MTPAPAAGTMVDGGSQKIRFDLGLAISAELVQKVIGYVVLVVLARYLPKDTMGEYFFALTLATFFAMASEVGTSKHLARVVSEEADRAALHLGRVLSLRLPLTALALAILVGVMGLLRPDILPLIALVGLSVLLSDLYYAVGATFVALRRMKLRFVTALLGHLGVLVVVLAGVRLGVPLERILLGYVGSHLVALVVAWAVFRARVGTVHLSWTPGELAGVLHHSWPFFLLGLLGFARFKVDTVMLFGLSSAAAVASYEAAYKLFEVSRIAVRPLQLIFFPLAARYAVAGDSERLRRLFRSLVFGVGGLGLLASAVVVAAAGVVVPIVWGARYVDAVPLLRILYLTVVPLYVAFVCSFVAYALHLERATLLVLSGALAVNVGLNAVAIPLAGPAGAAWTTLVTETLLALWLLVLVWRGLRDGPGPPSATEGPRAAVPGTAGGTGRDGFAAPGVPDHPGPVWEAASRRGPGTGPGSIP